MSGDCEYDTKGDHIICDAWGISKELLDDSWEIKQLMDEAIKLVGATVLNIDIKTFVPSGCTIIYTLSESHMSIHTYPDKGFAGIDMYTCGNVKTKDGMDFLLKELHATKANGVMIERGNKDGLYIGEYTYKE